MNDDEIKELREMQALIGKCSRFCKHCASPDSEEMYCNHPLAHVLDDYSLLTSMGYDSACVMWEGNIGFCKPHEIFWIGECPKCLDELVDLTLNEAESNNAV